MRLSCNVSSARCSLIDKPNESEMELMREAVKSTEDGMTLNDNIK